MNKIQITLFIQIFFGKVPTGSEHLNVRYNEKNQNNIIRTFCSFIFFFSFSMLNDQKKYGDVNSEQYTYMCTSNDTYM